jgi:hypothetical protein
MIQLPKMVSLCQLMVVLGVGVIDERGTLVE